MERHTYSQLPATLPRRSDYPTCASYTLSWREWVSNLGPCDHQANASTSSEGRSLFVQLFSCTKELNVVNYDHMQILCFKSIGRMSSHPFKPTATDFKMVQLLMHTRKDQGMHAREIFDFLNLFIGIVIQNFENTFKLKNRVKLINSTLFA